MEIILVNHKTLAKNKKKNSDKIFVSSLWNVPYSLFLGFQYPVWDYRIFATISYSETVLATSPKKSKYILYLMV